MLKTEIKNGVYSAIGLGLKNGTLNTFKTSVEHTMHAIQLHATPYQDQGFAHTLGLHVETRLQPREFELDDALAVLLQAVRQSRNPNAMDALGTLLGYMENLEKNQAALHGAQGLLNLTNPITMSL